MFAPRLQTTAIASLSLAICLACHGIATAAETAQNPAAQVTWTPAPESVINPSENTAHDAWESWHGKFTKQSVDQHLQDPVLKGAIDVHAHFGPDTYDRQWDAFEIAKMAQERGMRGVVFKNHWSESAGLAYLVRKYGNVPGLEVFGGLALNATVGGINPQAVRYFAEVEGRYAKVVWLPTHDSENEVKYNKENRPYVIVSRNGALIPPLLEVLDLVAQYKLTLATGHVYANEMVEIVEEAKKRGVERIIITHPGLGPQYTDPTIEQLQQATAMGAYAEVVASELFGKSRESTVRMMKTVGAAHCLVSSDSGLTGSANHPDALVRAIRILREEGFSDADLGLMFRANPAKALALPVQ